MKRLLLCTTLCFLFLTFFCVGGTLIKTPLLGLTPAKAEESTKPSLMVNTDPCKPTPTDALGPFYVPNAPERTSVGKGHVLSGVVRSSTDCSSLIGAQIEFWLAGSDGKYDDDHRATILSDKDGVYTFESNFPPPYIGRPSHIHIKISAKGYRTLVTQYYPAKGQAEGKFDLVLIPED